MELRMTTLNRRLLAVSLVFAAITAAQAIYALSQDNASLDRTIVHDLPVELPLTVASFGSAAERLGMFARVPLGIEDSVAPLDQNGAAPTALTLTGKSVHDVLDELSQRTSRYEWRQLERLVVLRPANAWNDPANVLNRMVAAVEWTNVDVADALDKTMSLVTGVQYNTPASTPDDRRFDVVLPEATILQLLNAIASNHGELIWHVSYRSGDTGAKFGIGFKTFSGHARWIWIPELPARPAVGRLRSQTNDGARPNKRLQPSAAGVIMSRRG
jgi:hypothetical protein